MAELKRSELPDSMFGIPEERKYPLDTEEHVRSAIKLFNHCEPKYEKNLAKRIKKRMKDFNVSDINVGPDNRFGKYYKPTSVTEATTYQLMSEEEIKEFIKRDLLKSDTKELQNLGNAILKALESGFSNLEKLLGVINVVLFLGLITVPYLILIISVLAIAVITLPLSLVRVALIKQQRFLKSSIKPIDMVKRYYSAVDNILRADTADEITLEAYLPVMEAPGDDDEEEEDTPEDYTEDAEEEDEPEPTEDLTADVTDEEPEGEEDAEEDPEDLNPEDFTNDAEEDDPEPEEDEGTDDEPEPTDVTDDDEPAEPEDVDAGTEEAPEGEDTEPTAEEPEDDETAPEDEEGVEEPAEGEAGEEDIEDTDDAADFTDDTDAEGTPENEGEEGTEGEEEAGQDETTDNTDETGQDPQEIQNSIIKNYNLMSDFSSLYRSLKDIIRRLQDVHYPTSIQNSVVDRCTNNLNKVQTEIEQYIEFNFSTDYTVNLYYYTTYVQAMKLNLEMLRTVGKLEKGTKQ